MSKDELREGNLQTARECVCAAEGAAPHLTSTDFTNVKIFARIIQAHVQREIAAFAEQAAQFVDERLRPLMATGGIHMLVGSGDLKREIRSLSPKTFEEMVRDAVLEARIEEAKWWADSKREHGPVTLYPNEQERIASLERERETRKEGSRT